MKNSKVLALILSCALLITVAGCGGASYGTINDMSIDADIYNAAASNAVMGYMSNGYDEQSFRDMLTQEDENGVTGAQAIKDYCLDSVKQIYAVDVMAKEHNITLTDADEKTLEENKASYIESSGSRADFVKSLKDSGFTEEAFDKLQRTSLLQQKVTTAIFGKGGAHEVSEAEIISDMTGNFVRVVHILVQAQANSADFAEKKAKAEGALARVNAGEDFNALIAELNEDPGMTSQPDGYLFDNQGYTLDGSQMVSEFTDAAWKLAVGQNSGLVQTDYGFHIIKRLPLDEAYIKANMDSYYSYYAGMAFSMELSQVIAELDVKTNAKYDKVDIASFIPKA